MELLTKKEPASLNELAYWLENLERNRGYLTKAEYKEGLKRALALTKGMELDNFKLYRNAVTKAYYSARNCLLLDAAALLGKPSFNSPLFAGFKQWKEQGRKVKKGEKARYVLLPCFKKADECKSPEEPEIKFFKTVAVFNYNQTESVANE